MRFEKITIGLCALMCFASLSAGCKDRSEAPLSDESSASSITYDDSSNGGESSSVSGGGAVSDSSGSSSQSPSNPGENSSAPHVHSRKLIETVDPTCSEDGFKLFRCDCGDELTKTLKATGHNYTEKTTAADCEHDGYTRYTCANCGDSYDENVIKALGHAWGDWKTVKEATTSAAGEKQSSCSRCGKTRSEAIPKLESSSSSNDFASEVVRLVNIERANYGLSPLKENTALSEYAQRRSKEIVSNFAHERPDGSSPLSYVLGLGGIRTCGENIAMGQRTPEAVVSAWMNSPGHRANILKSDFTMIGVGCYKSGGTYYWVQIFGG